MTYLAYLWDTLLAILPGVPITLMLTLVSFVLGVALAVPLALLRMSRNRLLSVPAQLYVAVFRGTPLLLQLFLIYYGLARFDFIRHSFLWVAFKDPVFCAILSFTLNVAAYASETVRGGLNSVRSGQIEAGRACGMSRALLYRRIIFPQAFRQALPAFGSEIIIMVKSTALASMVTVYEITGMATRIRTESYRFLEVLLAAALLYLLIAFVIARGVAALESRLGQQAKRPALAMDKH